MKSILKLLTFTTLLFFFTLLLTLPAFAAAATGPGSRGEGDPDCWCIHENTLPPNTFFEWWTSSNGFYCATKGPIPGTFGKSAFHCSADQVCQNTNNGHTPKCVAPQGDNNQPLPPITANSCWCDKPGVPGSGNNTKTCTDGKNNRPDPSSQNRACGLNEVCQNNPNALPALNPQTEKKNPGSGGEGDPNCKCTNPGDTTPGNNGMYCSSSFSIKPCLFGICPGNPPNAYCSKGQACIDSKTNGPQCLQPSNTNTTIPDKDGVRHPIAVCKPLNCNCDSNDTPGSGKNGMTCEGQGHIFPCSELQVCHQDKANDGQAACKQLDNCSCDTPDTPGDGKNGYTCIINRGTPELPANVSYHAFCGDRNEACVPVPNSKKVTCEAQPEKLNPDNPNAINYQDIPPPPSPPCTRWNPGNGTCLAVNTALSTTAAGDTSTNPNEFITQILQILIGIAGSLAVILIIIAGYRLMTSQGKPETIQQAREQLIAAIVGLLFLIFSLVIIQVIGVDILRIPGLSG